MMPLIYITSVSKVSLESQILDKTYCKNLIYSKHNNAQELQSHENVDSILKS